MKDRRNMEDPVIERSQSSSIRIRRLYDAAFTGDVPSLLALLGEDPLILSRCTVENVGRFAQSPLHIAASLGHLEFTKTIRSQQPELAKELDHLRRLPLHLASAKGYLEIVKTLLSVDPNMCLARDQDGKNAVHVAAMNGRNDVLEELLRAKPRAAIERTSDGETVLHLCIKYDRPESLRFLVSPTVECVDGELINSKDADGNTVLHLAVAAKQLEDTGGGPGAGKHTAGVSIMANADGEDYGLMITSSSIALVSSLTVILLLISGLPFRRLFVGVLMITMWIAIAAITFTFYFSVTYISDTGYASPVIMVPIAIVLLLLITHYIGRFTKNLIKKMSQCCC